MGPSSRVRLDLSRLVSISASGSNAGRFSVSLDGSEQRVLSIRADIDMGRRSKNARSGNLWLGNRANAIKEKFYEQEMFTLQKRRFDRGERLKRLAVASLPPMWKQEAAGFARLQKTVVSENRISRHRDSDRSEGRSRRSGGLSRLGL